MEQPLFDSAKDLNGGMEPTRSEIPLLFPTNLPNLIHFLSRGYLAPKGCFGEDDKYYRDLLAMVPGRLPLFTPPVSEEVIDLVQRESRRTARPVLVELDAADLVAARVPGVDEEERSAEVFLDSREFKVAAPPVVITTGKIRCIHFLDDRDLKTARRRRFGNVRELPEALAKVSPGLRDEIGLSVGALQSWFSSLDAPTGPTPQEFKDVDKTAGAAALMAHSNPELAEGILNLLNGRDRTSGQLPSWISLDGSGAAAGASTADAKTRHTADRIVFQSASSALRATSPRSLRPRETLKEINKVLTESEGLPNQDRKNIRESVKRIENILASEAPFDGVKNDRYPSLQGLMFFLIKDSPEPLMQWSPADTGASTEAHLASAAYCGLVYGHAGLPLEFRSESLDQKLAEWAAGELTNLPSDAEESRARDVKEAIEKPNSISQQVRTKFLEADLENEGPVRNAAIELCRKKSWTDCIETLVFAVDRSEVETRVTKEGGNNQKLKMAWRIPGAAEVRYSLDTERFRSRIRQDEIAEDLLEDVAEQYSVR